MHILSLLILAIFFPSTWVYALPNALAIPQSENSKIYLRPESHFSSGVFPTHALLAQTRRVETRRWYQVRVDQGSGWVSSQQLITDWNLIEDAQTFMEAPFRSQPVLSENPSGTLSNQQRIEIKNWKNGWVQTQHPLSAEDIWIEDSYLRAHQNHWGRAFVPKRVSLLQKSHGSSPIVTRIPAGTFVKVNGAKNSFLEVIYKNKNKSFTGFINYKNLVSRLNFATHYRIKSKWHEAVSESPVKIQVKGLRQVGLEDIDAFKSDEIFAFVNSTRLKLEVAPTQNSVNGPGLKFLQKVQILDSHDLKWGRSMISEHGEVWWAINTEPFAASARAARPIFTFGDLKKRGIVSLATHPRHKEIQFASARGLFRTLDGENWEKLGKDGQDDFPLVMTSGGVLFAGPYRSTDLGETFLPFFRLEQLLSLISSLPGYRGPRQMPRRMAILRLEKVGSKRLRFQVDLGKKKPVWIETDQAGQSWKLVGSEKIGGPSKARTITSRTRFLNSSRSSKVRPWVENAGNT